MELLQEEVRFNQSLSETLSRLQNLRLCLDSIQQHIAHERLSEAAALLDDFSHQLPLSAALGGARIASTLDNLNINQREEIAKGLTQSWHEYVRVDEHSKKIEILEHKEGLLATPSDSLTHAYGTQVVTHQH